MRGKVVWGPWTYTFCTNNAAKRLHLNQLTSLPVQGHVGRAATRVEDAALLTGRASFVDDAGVKPGTLHAAILRSPHGHAEILAIDSSDAGPLAIAAAWVSVRGRMRVK